MVDFPIVDTHVHLWDPNHLRYSWLDGIPLLNQRYLLEEYRQACGAVQVEQMVFVQCECDAGQHVQEAEWVSGLARQDGRIRGIVANAPLERGAAVDEDLEVLAAIPLVKGIRRLLQSEDAGFACNPGSSKGSAFCRPTGCPSISASSTRSWRMRSNSSGSAPTSPSSWIISASPTSRTRSSIRGRTN